MKRIVTFGGGTGTFVVLSALKRVPNIHLTAVVSGADDGGSTGTLRDAYGFLPAGDVRQALVALSPEESVLRELFAYRFSKGNIAGHNLGNLFLTALSDIFGSSMKAIEEASRVLNISGTVVCSTDEPATLSALLEDGTVLVGEHLIDERAEARKKIKVLSYETALPLSVSAQRAIKSADVIVLGPGDLYTSTIASVLASGTKETISASSAKIVYIVNLFTKMGQTNDLTAKEHVETLTRYIGRRPDIVIVHDGSFPTEALEKYEAEGEFPVPNDLGHNASVRNEDVASVHSVPPVAGDFVHRSLVRHDPEKLARVLESLL